jgi:ABC-type Fe3+/spermidine/putrescine transport system ATPase subunit
MVLRVIAGLARARGRVLFEDEDVTPLPPARRGVGIVFQDGALWPHVSVREHLALGLRQSGISHADVRRRADVALGRLGLTGVADERPDALSLELRCRLALARALVLEPRVLVLDEPLAHLDPVTRKMLRLEIARLHADLAVTTVHATRDAADALALSHRIAVLVDGRVAQIGEPEEVYGHPSSRPVAEALGPVNLLPVRVVEVRETGVVVESPGGSHTPVAATATWRTGMTGLLCTRPESLGLVDAAMGRGPGFRGKVALRLFEGARHLYEVDVGGGATVRVELPPGSGRIFRLGEQVRVEIDSTAAVLLPE